MLKFIDGLLNRITMYRLVLYYLIFLLVTATAFGYFGILPYSPVALGFSVLILLLVSWAANSIFAAVYKSPANVESVYITALILALIIAPTAPQNFPNLMFLVWAAVWAMASKYLFAINKKHLFNPAAFAVALTAVTIGQTANWWVGGNMPMLIFVLLGGFLIIRKIQRFDLVFAYLAGVLGMVAFAAFIAGKDPVSSLQAAVSHAPIFFFASIMLTEPLTTPPTRPLRIAYGAFVGLLFAPTVHVGAVYSTPELALLAGNLFSYLVSPKRKYLLTLREKTEVGTGIYNFAFSGGGKMDFRPGQYMEWTLGHRGSDSRGNRRYFTIASSPTEEELHLGVRFYKPSSSFKKALLEMEPGGIIMGGQLAGDFTLPRDPGRKLAFIAGGIGITPFRSMVKYLADRGEARDIVLLYSNRTADEISYREIFDDAAGRIGLRTVYAITDAEGLPQGEDAHHGRIDAALIRTKIPDYRSRMFYISGTHAMTTAFKEMLAELGVPKNQIKTDFFPGFA